MLREGDAETRPAAGWEELYGRLILQDGIAAIPLALYLYQGLLQLSAQQVWFAGVILAHKWDAELPSPRLPALAAATGVSVRTLQYLRASLCRAGLLEVQESYDAAGRRTANRYDFSGLFARLEAAIAADPAEPNDLEEGPGAPDPPPGSPRSFTARFGRVIARQGIAAVPQALFTHQAALGLAPQHAWFVAYILGRRWSAGLPHPSLRRMAQRTGYSERQIHNLKDELVRRGYLRLVHRHGAGGGQDTNGYDFSGLLAAIQAELRGASGKPPGAPAPPQPPAVLAIPEAALPPRRGRRTAAAAQPRGRHDAAGATGFRGAGASRFLGAGARLFRAPGASQYSGTGATRFRGAGAREFRGAAATG